MASDGAPPLTRLSASAITWRRSERASASVSAVVPHVASNSLCAASIAWSGTTESFITAKARVRGFDSDSFAASSTRRSSPSFLGTSRSAGADSRIIGMVAGAPVRSGGV